MEQESSPGFAPILNYCCTIPAATNGLGNITNEPLFLALSSNLRLQSNSPCINAGTNGLVIGITDLDGRARVAGGIVDIGAFEFQPGINPSFMVWLQQYGLPMDGTADFSDTDSDGTDNWQEWVCGTNPTNAASVLRLLTPAANSSGVIVSWQSVENKSYFLQSAMTPASPLEFVTIATNILGHSGTTTYTDTNAPAGQPNFYRVGVGL